MRAMVLEAAKRPLEPAELPEPEPGAGQVALRVIACGVCRTDLHIVDGELDELGASTAARLGFGLRPPPHRPKLPLVLGHQVVGEVVGAGPGAERFERGARVGLPWLAWADGECRYCRSGRENLCPRARFTGYDVDGGYAELAVADERFCLELPADAGIETAPLLCAGLIGFRALRMCGDAERLGLFGFGASAHLVAQVAAHQGRRVFAVTRGADPEKRELAREVGAEWVGVVDELPEELDAVIIFAPAGELVPVALRALAPGGVVVCAGIHMSDIPSFPYELLWGERRLRSVANLTREDGRLFLELAPQVPVRARTTVYELERANEALDDLRSGALTGSAVLSVSE
jgi:propanol-preferring alcohol dehydrogenase